MLLLASFPPTCKISVVHLSRLESPSLYLRLSTVAPWKVLTATFGFKLSVLIPFKIELPTNSVDVCIDFLGLVVKSIFSITSPVGVVVLKGGYSDISLKTSSIANCGML